MDSGGTASRPASFAQTVKRGTPRVTRTGTIRLDTMHLFLDAGGYGTTNGTKARLWRCTGNDNQMRDTRNWHVGYGNPAASGEVLDDTGYGRNGTQQDLWTDHNGINQHWATC